MRTLREKIFIKLSVTHCILENLIKGNITQVFSLANMYDKGCITKKDGLK
jgi:hypothetical protein